ncbi:GyrI-like domain-containing protein [Rhodococcus sp. SGAir0479]|uniref:GyrI-like domain-containing protein n=1 Tax=Rhodococcus sp. SGAir0479 TaxID=2567884 RepID=UPI0010CCC5CE|nr:GyrI-like domain-containing protein [Rhodococcus sp. SGAir0479]QCQ91241.1 AraC family transcriptional regulator [Rhodococcus sp. SGAir0479]
MSYDIRVRDLPARPTALVADEVSVEAIPLFLGPAFRAVARVVEAADVPITGPPFARYLPMPGGRWHVEAGFSLARPIDATGTVLPSWLPGGPCASTVHVGGYDTVESAYVALTDWITENDCVTTGQAWECYLDDPDAELPRTEVFMPIFRLAAN